ncbi:MAG: phytanoyl-CoA dioxygenase family protein [Acidimicrobiales bacterium]|jgi:ectoine hydroxylase-related dioxygenase (phytanoyl-CoA dioxygenase family)
MTRELTRDEIDTYRSDGVVHVTQAVDGPAIAQMTAAAEHAIESPSKFGRNMTAPGQPGMFFQDRHLFPHDQQFRDLLHDLPLASLAAQATESETVRVYYEHVFVKDPGTQEEFVWHQDRPYWAVDGTQICSTWVALTSADASTSALEFVRGSHATGITYRPEYPALEGKEPDEVEDALWRGVAEHIRSYPDRCPAFEEHPDKFDVISFAVEPGDALIFDFRTVHRSGPNSGATRRAAISWRWLGDDAYWAPKPGSDPIVRDDDTTVEPGCLIDDDATFPVVHTSSNT